jgi:hypothetical protein
MSSVSIRAICDPAIGGQACDQTLVVASAAQLSTMGGTFRAKLLGDGFVTLDRVLTPHQHLYGAAEHVPVLRGKQCLP